MKVIYEKLSVTRLESGFALEVDVMNLYSRAGAKSEHDDFYYVFCLHQLGLINCSGSPESGIGSAGVDGGYADVLRTHLNQHTLVCSLEHADLAENGHYKEKGAENKVIQIMLPFKIFFDLLEI